jgi:hypothetical protein
MCNFIITPGEVRGRALPSGSSAKLHGAPGPFFTFGDGRALTRERFVAALRWALASAGLDCSAYAGQSFRIGAATLISGATGDPGLPHPNNGAVAEHSIHALHRTYFVR